MNSKLIITKLGNKTNYLEYLSKTKLKCNIIVCMKSTTEQM